MTPQDMTAPQGAPDDQSQDAAEGAAVATIELSIAQDGSITMELESGAQEAGEEGGAEPGNESQPVSVGSIDEAKDVLEQMYNSVVQSSDQQATANKAAQTAGYSQA